ncbi:MAG: glycosyltransferase family 9 protein [Roseburia sp.]|nr:glycosyltransferase family 9 protein [Roseburia sp.]MCM1421044.1 glycosyltransferase family 9 protein [Bacteroides sp.]
MTRLLIIRFSAMGDVAMTVPVIHSLAALYPELRVTVLTQRRFSAFFDWMPPNVEVKGIALSDYQGIWGLNRLFSELRAGHYDMVADLHDVLRTKYLRTCFRMSGTKVATVDKGRADKHALIGHGLEAEGLKPMAERYADVFRELGYELSVDFVRAFDCRKENLTRVRSVVGGKQNDDIWIGVAPFAAHKGKIYPLESMRKVVDMLSDKGCRVFLFGAGKEETAVLESWEKDGVTSVCGKLGSLHNEMLLMSRMNMMIAMDSANMHLASIVGVPTVSVWGATHPKTGFMGWGQAESSVVQLDLPCRPCSVYGNKPCKYGDFRCMAGIAPEQIVDKVVSMLG